MENKKVETRLTPRIKEPGEIIKEVKIQSTGRQLITPIPALVVEALGIVKGDKVIFRVSLRRKNEYSIKIKRGRNGR